MNLLVLALAVFRISSLISEERGPYRILERFREFLGAVESHDGTMTGKGELARGIICFWCVSVWVGIVVSVLYWLVPEITVMACVPFALSGVAVVLYEIGER